jgi:pSer/pThr/pTyr-binding forkhead associated (FHA) protein
VKLRLKIIKGSGEGKTFVFTKAPIRVGRASDNDLVLNDDGISRRQCEIVIEPTGVMLRDFESANGTKVNDVIATETELKAGDSIGMGPVIFEVLEIDANAEIRATGTRMSFEAAKKAAETAKAGERRHTKKPIEPTPMADGKDAGTRPSTRSPRSDEGLAAKARRLLRRKSNGKRALAVKVGFVTMVVVAACGVWYVIVHTMRTDHSGEVVPIDKTMAHTSYGKGNVDVLTSDRVSFSFDANGGRVEIGYAVASIERGDQLEILVNGERVGYAPQTASGWSTGLEIVVPRRLLRQGRNIVTFDNLDIPARGTVSDERWAVGQITESEVALPKPDPVKAKQFYDLGKAAFDTRSVAPQNLTRSVSYLEEARLYVAAEETPSALSQQIEKELTKVNAELQSTFETHIFTAQQALRFGETERARDALREILRYFPDPNDPHHQTAKQKLTELGFGNAP